MKILITCLDWGREKSRKGLYCKPCGYIHRSRPSGLKYTLHKENPTSFKNGRTPINKGTSKPYYDRSIGYLKIRNNGNQMKHHRYVLEKALGRKLQENEIVHHIDHNKLNNDISNLKIMTRSEHMKLHWELRRVYA
jgi:hypothetical protein